MIFDELERARELADKGAALSPDQATCRRIQSLVRIFLREHQAAEQYLKLALELNPLDAECIEQMGFLLTLRGRPIDALSWFARAIRLNPLHPHWYQYDRSLALYLSGDYRAAAEALNLSTRLTPWIRTRLAACHAQLGELEIAYQHIALARESHPVFSPADYAANGVPFENPSDAAHLADGILMALGSNAAILTGSARTPPADTPRDAGGNWRRIRLRAGPKPRPAKTVGGSLIWRCNRQTSPHPAPRPMPRARPAARGRPRLWQTRLSCAPAVHSKP